MLTKQNLILELGSLFFLVSRMELKDTSFMICITIISLFQGMSFTINVNPTIYPVFEDFFELQSPTSTTDISLSLYPNTYTSSHATSSPGNFPLIHSPCPVTSPFSPTILINQLATIHLYHLYPLVPPMIIVLSYSSMTLFPLSMHNHLYPTTLLLIHLLFH